MRIFQTKTGMGIGFAVVIVWLVPEITWQAALQAHSVDKTQRPAPVAAM